MSAYVVGRIHVKDLEQYKKYTQATPAIIQKYGGKFLVRAGRTVTFEGSAESRVVIIEFPSLEKAQQFYHSPEYQQARQLRLAAAEGALFAVEGV